MRKLKSVPKPTPPPSAEVRKLVEQLSEFCPYLNEPIFQPLVEEYAANVLLLRRVHAELANMTLTDADGELRRSLVVLMGLQNMLLKLAREMGLTPSSRAELQIAAGVKPVLDLQELRLLMNGNH